MAVKIRRETVITPEIAFADARGRITNLPNLVAVITSAKGSRRASHWHPHDHQTMYLISGRYRAIAQEIDGDGLIVPGTRTEQVVEAGQLAYCPPRLAHAYEFLEDSVFLNLTTEDRSQERFAEHTIRLDGWPWDDTVR